MTEELKERKLLAEIRELEKPFWLRGGFLGPLFAVLFALGADQFLGVSKSLKAEADANQARLNAGIENLELRRNQLLQEISNFESEKDELLQAVKFAKTEATDAKQQLIALQKIIDENRAAEKRRINENIAAAEAERAQAEALKRKAELEKERAETTAAIAAAESRSAIATQQIDRFLLEESYFRERGMLIP